MEAINVFYQKVSKMFYSSSMEPVDWENFIWLDECHQPKVGSLKIVYGCLPIDLEVKKSSGFMYDNNVKSFSHYSIVIWLWKWLKVVFRNLQFSSLDLVV